MHQQAGVALKKIREQTGLTQVEFSHVLGIKQANLSAMESGRRSIGKALAKRIGERFKVDHQVLL